MSGVVTQNVLGSSGLVKAPEAGGGAWVEIKTLLSLSSLKSANISRLAIIFGYSIRLIIPKHLQASTKDNTFY